MLMATRSVDSNDSDCFVCRDGGDLVCCDICIRSFHGGCLNPVLDTSGELPKGDWACPLCSGFGQGRFNVSERTPLRTGQVGEETGVSTRMDTDQGQRRSLRTRSAANGVIKGSNLANQKAKVERLDGLSSPVQGRALVGKLNPRTPVQVEGAGGRSLRKRGGKDVLETPEQNQGFGSTGKRRAQGDGLKVAELASNRLPTNGVPSNGFLSNGLSSHGLSTSGLPNIGSPGGGLPTNGFPANKEETPMKVEPMEVDLRTPEAPEKKRAGSGGSATIETDRKGKMAESQKQAEVAETVLSGSRLKLEVDQESKQSEGVVGIVTKYGNHVKGSAQPELESDDDNPIAARADRKRAKNSVKREKASVNGFVQIVGGTTGLANDKMELEVDVSKPEEKRKRQRAVARKRKTADVSDEAGPSGAAPGPAPGGGVNGAPAGAVLEEAEVEERPRNRRRNRAAVAPVGGAGDAPGGEAADAAAGGAQGDRGEQARRRFLAIARRRAAHFAHFAGDDHVADAEEEGDEAEAAPDGGQVAAAVSSDEERDWPGPFSTARKLVREREAIAAARGATSAGESAPRPVVDWSPSRTPDAAALFVRRQLSSLFDMSVRLLVDNAEFVESMEGIPDAVRKRVAAGFCARRKMIPETLSLFFQGAPGEIVLPDCTLVGETEMTAAMAQTDAQRLEVLELGMCGRCITDQGLSATLASGANTLPQLLTLSLRGAYRLTDSAVEKLLIAAPNVTSLELRKCSLLSEAAIQRIADCLGGRLKGLSLEGCAQLDGASIQPSLLLLSGLRRLNLTALSNVTDALVQELSVTLGSGLEELGLGGAKELSDAAVAAIAACCPNLTLLDLDGAIKLTDVAVGRLADGCRGLRHVSFRLGKFTDEALAAFVTASGSQLRHVGLNNVRKAGNATLVALSKHARDSMTSLDVSWCRHVSDQGLGLLADSCTHLRNLRLFGCSQITDVFLSGHSNPELVVTGQGDDVR